MHNLKFLAYLFIISLFISCQSTPSYLGKWQSALEINDGSKEFITITKDSIIDSYLSNGKEKTKTGRSYKITGDTIEMMGVKIKYIYKPDSDFLLDNGTFITRYIRP